MSSKLVASSSSNAPANDIDILQEELVAAKKKLVDAEKEVTDWTTNVKNAALGSPEKAEAKYLLEKAENDRAFAERQRDVALAQLEKEKDRLAASGKPS